ncbi:MAG: hypothetical protein JWO89_1317 [Verrucomicrobiaceae bacterium]|nr:hypothetical protein [Verrucomicrobiaceae bacterium]
MKWKWETTPGRTNGKKSVPKGLIPLCKSLFLQDVCIALGKRMKAVRYANRELTIVAAFKEGEDHERLEVEARSLDNRTHIVLWADSIAWVSHSDRFRQEDETTFELPADLSLMDSEAIAELLRRSLINLEEVKDVWQSRALP